LRLQEFLAKKPLYYKKIDYDRMPRAYALIKSHITIPKIIHIVGTNGKGSSVAMLESILLSGGYRVGSYTSPHLLRYNERIRLQGDEVSDVMLCDAFARVDQARADTALTYFEFGTLAAIDIFMGQVLDIVIMEVGLGGRLDAVNVLDSDVALVTSVGIDHQEWLGTDRESIGREKAGIFRSGCPAVCGDPEPPDSLVSYADKLGSPLYLTKRDFDYSATDSDWSWRGPEQHRAALSLPALAGSFQLRNAAAVLMVLELLDERFKLCDTDIRRGLESVTLPGRFQIISGEITQIFDVGHNPHAANVLARTLSEQPFAGRTLIVTGMLADKDHDGVFAYLCPQVDEWYAADLNIKRDAGGGRLSRAVKRVCSNGSVCCFSSVTEAYKQAMQDAGSGDRVVVFGSFYTVAEVLPEAV